MTATVVCSLWDEYFPHKVGPEMSVVVSHGRGAFRLGWRRDLGWLADNDGPWLGHDLACLEGLPDYVLPAVSSLIPEPGRELLLLQVMDS